MNQVRNRHEMMGVVVHEPVDEFPELTSREVEVLGLVAEGLTADAAFVDGSHRFHEVFEQMLDLVRREGTPLGEDELEESDVILPPPDISFVEASEEFTGEGLIPD